MRIFDLARRPPQWLRVAFAGLLFAFALNAVAHVTHQHEVVAPSVAHSTACGYCVSFGSLADAPRQHSWSPPLVEQAGVQVDPAAHVVFALRPQTAARPRAPPIP